MSRLRQTDTYYRVPAGRLKLREVRSPDGASAELIAYHRPDFASARWSAYDCVPIALTAVAALKRGLAATLGELIVVAKERDVGRIGSSRIHLDTVHDLGTFLEIETVATGRNPAAAPAELAAIVARLQLGAFPPVGESYSDLLLARVGISPRTHGEES